MKKITIWNDNQNTDNYNLYFEDNEQSPNNITLISKDDDKNGENEKWRFDIVSKDYIDTKNNEQDAFITDVSNLANNNSVNIGLNRDKNIEQDTNINNLQILTTTIMGDVSTLNGKVNNLENTQATIINTNEEQTNKIEYNNNKITMLEERLNDIDGTNREQGGRLDHLEDEIKKIPQVVIEGDSHLTTEHINFINNLNDGLHFITCIFKFTSNKGNFGVPCSGWLYKENNKHYATLQKTNTSNCNVDNISLSFINTTLTYSFSLPKEDIKDNYNIRIDDITTQKVIYNQDFDITLEIDGVRTIKTIKEWLSEIINKNSTNDGTKLKVLTKNVPMMGFNHTSNHFSVQTSKTTYHVTNDNNDLFMHTTIIVDFHKHIVEGSELFLYIFSSPYSTYIPVNLSYTVKGSNNNNVYLFINDDNSGVDMGYNNSTLEETGSIDIYIHYKRSVDHED